MAATTERVWGDRVPGAAHAVARAVARTSAPPERPGTGLLLLELLRGGEGRSATRPLAADDWRRLLAEAERQGVSALLLARLEATPTPDVPDGALADLRRTRAARVLRSTAQREELARVLTALRDAGIDVVALKGAHLAHLVYATPALRPMSDFDLLVRRDALAHAARALGALGYRPAAAPARSADEAIHHHVPALARPGAPWPVELHWTLSPPAAPFAVDVEGLWRRARRSRIVGVECRVLSHADALLHLCTHAAYNHGFQVPARALCDLAHLVARHGDAAFWRAAADVASADGRSAIVYVALRVAQEALGVAVPAATLGRLAHGAADERVVASALRLVAADDAPVPATWQAMGEHDSLGARMAVLARSIAPPPSRLAEMYGLPRGARRVYGYYLVRPFDLLLRRGADVVSLLLRAPPVRGALARERDRRAVVRWIRRRSAPERTAP